MLPLSLLALSFQITTSLLSYPVNSNHVIFFLHSPCLSLSLLQNDYPIFSLRCGYSSHSWNFLGQNHQCAGGGHHHYFQHYCSGGDHLIRGFDRLFRCERCWEYRAITRQRPLHLWMLLRRSNPPRFMLWRVGDHSIRGSYGADQTLQDSCILATTFSSVFFNTAKDPTYVYGCVMQGK